MGVTKKPAVVAKTAPKKRGRPVGSKNQSTAGKELAALGGKTSIDWEKLAKQLQEALASEMKTNEHLESLFEDMKSKVIIAEHVSFGKRLKFLFTGNL